MGTARTAGVPGGAARVRQPHQGFRAIVTGRLRQRSFETGAGEQRIVVELEADEVGASLRFASAKVTRVVRTRAAAIAMTRPRTPTSRPSDPGRTDGRP